MRSLKHGKNISSKAEITGITRFGLWMLIDEVEYFLAFNEFPWFKSASVEEIYNFEFKFGKHLHWPNLDVDLEVDSFKNLEKYKLKYSK